MTKKHCSYHNSFMHDLVQDKLGMQYSCPESLQRTHFGASHHKTTTKRYKKMFQERNDS